MKDKNVLTHEWYVEQANLKINKENVDNKICKCCGLNLALNVNLILICLKCD